MRFRRFLLATLVMASFLLAVGINLESQVEYPQAKVVFYASHVKFPLPSIPEPVLKGKEFYVIVSGKDANAIVSSRLENIYGSFEFKLKSITQSNNNGMYNLTFGPVLELPDGLYNLTLVYKNETAEVIPNSIWVISSFPNVVKLFVFGDVKTPTGVPYLYETIKEMNLVNPTLAVFLGDLVETPSISSAWQLFLGSYLMSRIPTYVVSGNHEFEGVGVSDIYQSIFGPLNYSVRIGNFQLVVLPTDADGWIREKYITWADEVLSKSNSSFKILAFHHPLFSPSLKDNGSAVFYVRNESEVDKLAASSAIYSSFRAHPDETKLLLKVIIQRDVRLILSEHIHTDLNVLLIDWHGNKHYFISPAAIAYDVADYDIRGYKLLTLYSNGSLNEASLYYNGTGMFNYPNSIPIDSGEKVLPYKIGYLKYYYINNDGKHHIVSFFAKNELNEKFENIRITFLLPKNKSIDSYRWSPFKPSFSVFNSTSYYVVNVANITLLPKSTFHLTVYDAEDSSRPKGNFFDELSFNGRFSIANFKAYDEGWGIGDVSFYFSTDNSSWKPAILVDLIPLTNSTCIYKVWTNVSSDQISGGVKLYLKAEASDLAGNKVIVYGLFPAKKQEQPPQQVAQPSFPIEVVMVTIAVIVVVVAYYFIKKKL